MGRTAYSAEAMITKSNFHSRSVFAENLIAVEMRKLEIKFDKPDLHEYVHTRHIESLLVRISPRVHVTDVSR